MSVTVLQGTFDPLSTTKARDLRQAWVGAFSGVSGWTIEDHNYVNDTSERSVITNDATGFSLMLYNSTNTSDLRMRIAFGLGYTTATHILSNLAFFNYAFFDNNVSTNGLSLSGIGFNPTSVTSEPDQVHGRKSVNATASMTDWTVHISNIHETAIMTMNTGDTNVAQSIYFGEYDSLIQNPVYKKPESVFNVTSLGSTDGSVEYLIVAGGGGGGTYRGGGGGAGGIIEGTTTISSGSYTINVGTGGQGGSLSAGTSGDISTAFGLTAFGGGGGGLGSNGENAGLDGGSGGGEGGAAFTNAQGLGTTLDSSQGNDGGAAYLFASSDPRHGGGGGGAGASGSNATSTTSGSGGIGIISSITGTNKYYAGGGGGAGNSTEASGGLGGGGNGNFSTDASNGLNSTGSGGGGAGGGYESSNKGGNGGSGVVIIRYPLTGSHIEATGGTVTEYEENGTTYRVHTFDEVTGHFYACSIVSSLGYASSGIIESVGNPNTTLRFNRFSTRNIFIEQVGAPAKPGLADYYSSTPTESRVSPIWFARESVNPTDDNRFAPTIEANLYGWMMGKYYHIVHARPDQALWGETVDVDGKVYMLGGKKTTDDAWLDETWWVEIGDSES